MSCFFKGYSQLHSFVKAFQFFTSQTFPNLSSFLSDFCQTELEIVLQCKMYLMEMVLNCTFFANIKIYRRFKRWKLKLSLMQVHSSRARDFLKKGFHSFERDYFEFMLVLFTLQANSSSTKI